MTLRWTAVRALALLIPVAALSAQSNAKIPRDTFDAWMSRLSNAGRWGSDDQLGTLNLITPAKRRAAAQSVREGITISLGNELVTGADSNLIAPLRFGLMQFPYDTLATAAVDTLWVLVHGWKFTHVDAISHFTYRGAMYNSHPTSHLRPEGASRLDIDKMHAGIVSRGVLVDMARHKGVPFLAASTPITAADIEAWERANNVRIEQGDVLLLRTGRAERTKAYGPWVVRNSTAGPHPSLAFWLKARGVAALGSDVANEVSPSLVPGNGDPLHFLTIVAQGMPLFDNLNLEALATEAAARSRPTFMFVAAPLRIRGGTGSPLNPLAIF
jgi:kynurenine formamidase